MISGPDGVAKAVRLAEALTPALQGKAVVSHPVRKGELRLTGLDDSVTTDYLVASLSSVEFGGCQTSNITLGSVTEGKDRLGAVWTKCPLDVATKVAKVSRLRVEWSNINVSFAWPPALVLKCLEFCHVRQTCKNTAAGGSNSSFVRRRMLFSTPPGTWTRKYQTKNEWWEIGGHI
ncbi:uncharacterized protein LOC109861629 [Pseudomyrmex gracilis]|uniref:uncharacterized protein LOC109861629 n=1 Tax=Pseudomyrmex gracilis TaxID=219809 RepID=UPI000994A516|nr:uncharacterized protein LOC109861629 [Pseudomyrmex gracilis]